MECFLVGFDGDWADSELARLGSAAVSIDRSCGDLVEWNCYIVSNRQVALNRQVVTNRHRRSEPAFYVLAHQHYSGALRPLSESGRSASMPGLSLGVVVVWQPIFL